MNKKIGLVIGVIVLLILIIGLPFAIKLVQERQNLQKQAAVSGGSATVSLSTANTATIQGRIPVTVSLKTPQSPNGITIIKTTLNITSAGNSPLVSVTASDIENSLSSSLTYYDPIINTSGSTITITLQAAYVKAGTSGFLGANDTFTNFAVINLLANTAGTVNINLDMNNSEIRDKNGNLDILNDQAGGKSITITSDVTATATPTTPAGTATATPTPTTRTGTTATLTPTTATAGTTTATPTPTVKTNATATPTTISRGGTTLPTNTPIPIASIDQVKLTSLTSGQTVPTSRPTFSGTASPNSTVTITVRSDPITVTVTADASGRWTWTPTEDLGPGSHTVTITAVAPTGKTTTTTSTFTVGSLPITGNISLTLILLGCGLLILLPVLVGLIKKAPINS